MTDLPPRIRFTLDGSSPSARNATVDARAGVAKRPRGRRPLGQRVGEREPQPFRLEFGLLRGTGARQHPRCCRRCGRGRTAVRRPGPPGRRWGCRGSPGRPQGLAASIVAAAGRQRGGERVHQRVGLDVGGVQLPQQAEVGRLRGVDLLGPLRQGGGLADCVGRLVRRNTITGTGLPVACGGVPGAAAEARVPRPRSARCLGSGPPRPQPIGFPPTAPARYRASLPPVTRSAHLAAGV